MNSNQYPFNITPDNMNEFDRKQNELHVHDNPVRQAGSFWDFIKDSNIESILAPEAMELFGKGGT